MFRGYAQDKHDVDLAMLAVNEACCAFLAGHLDDARRALDKAGDEIDPKVIESYKLEADEVVGRTYAATGASKTTFASMQKEIAAGNLSAAAKLCRHMLAGVKPGDKGRPYLRTQSVLLDIQVAVRRGRMGRNPAGGRPCRLANGPRRVVRQRRRRPRRPL